MTSLSETDLKRLDAIYRHLNELGNGRLITDEDYYIIFSKVIPDIRDQKRLDFLRGLSLKLDPKQRVLSESFRFWEEPQLHVPESLPVITFQLPFYHLPALIEILLSKLEPVSFKINANRRLYFPSPGGRMLEIYSSRTLHQRTLVLKSDKNKWQVLRLYPDGTASVDEVSSLTDLIDLIKMVKISLITLVEIIERDRKRLVSTIYWRNTEIAGLFREPFISVNDQRQMTPGNGSENYFNRSLNEMAGITLLDDFCSDKTLDGVVEVWLEGQKAALHHIPLTKGKKNGIQELWCLDGDIGWYRNYYYQGEEVSRGSFGKSVVKDIDSITLLGKDLSHIIVEYL